jgi:hypothetical protein
MGVSLPVWFNAGNTSEPANEVFCNYILTNTPNDYPVAVLSNGYKINLPQVPPNYPMTPRPAPPFFENLSRSELDEWHKKNPLPPTGRDLLPLDRGGIEGIKFKRYVKTIEGGRRMNVVHSVEINKFSVLEESLTL